MKGKLFAEKFYIFLNKRAFSPKGNQFNECVVEKALIIVMEPEK